MFGLNKGFLCRFISKFSNIFCFEINRFFCLNLLFAHHSSAEYILDMLKKLIYKFTLSLLLDTLKETRYRRGTKSLLQLTEQLNTTATATLLHRVYSYIPEV